MTGDHLMPQKTFTVTIYREGSACFIPVDFDPKAERKTTRGRTPAGPGAGAARQQAKNEDLAVAL
jgi:hypothetical protein